MKTPERSSGVLAPIFSLPGTMDIGTLGRPVRALISFLAAAGQSWFQTLPVNPVDEAGSPYAGRSAFAGEILYLDLEELYQEDLIPETTKRNQTRASLKEGTFPLLGFKPGRVDYSRARERRKPFWNEAFERYRAGRGGERYRKAEEEFRVKNDFWLNDYALFRAAAETFRTCDWTRWPEDVRRRDPGALRVFAKEASDSIERTRFLQLVFDVQWREFKKKCADDGVKLFGDLPIYVGKSSADVWARPELFMVTRDGRMIREAGSPPDDYNPNGQRWGSPTYRWSRCAETDFQWWKDRVKKTLERFDMVRLDHFIGFYNYYSFPGAEYTSDDENDWVREQNAARRLSSHPDDAYELGWVPGPQERFFNSLFSIFPSEAFVAEDLGVMNEGVVALRDRYNLPGMRVLQFSFDNVKIDPKTNRAPNPMKTWPESSVGYTGTHDGAPILGWLDDARRFGGRQWKTLDFQAIMNVLRRYRARRDPPAPMRDSRPFLTLWSRIADALRLSRPKLGIAKRSPQLPPNIASAHAAVMRAVADSRCRVVIFPLQDVLGLSNDSRINFPGVEKDAWSWRLNYGGNFVEDAEFLAQVTSETARMRRPVN